MKNYFIKFISESGDHYVLGTFSNEDYPARGQLDSLARQELSHEISDDFLYGRFDVTELGVSKPMPETDPTSAPLERP